MHRYNDLAIPLAWPDQTARGDELWMSIFRKLGVIKNLNFKVGHAAIVLIERRTGNIAYFDFGRYITPRGFGRARSAAFDPRLELSSKANFDEQDQLSNLEEILAELATKEQATHGAGTLLCSECYAVSFSKAVQFAEKLVDKGPVLYGALAPSNNSCSRYVAQILVEAMEKEDPRINKILFPENLKASPTSNVVNAVAHQQIYRYKHGLLHKIEMDRWQSLKYQVQLLHPNFIRSKAKELPDDRLLGHVHEPFRPQTLPEQAQWLGGLGEGAWFALNTIDTTFEIQKYDCQGNLEYQVVSIPEGEFNAQDDYEFSYFVHYQKHVLKQQGQEISFRTLNMADNALKQSI